jgi:hypothetical protein
VSANPGPSGDEIDVRPRQVDPAGSEERLTSRREDQAIDLPDVVGRAVPEPAETPHLSLRTWWWLWGSAFAVLVVLVVLAFIAAT